jgi:hypothetical protein
VFGNKGLRWKLGAALAAIALLGVYAERRGESINPSLWRCCAQPERWKDQTLWVPAAQVVSTGPREHEISSGSVRIRVTGPAPAPTGARVAYIAVFRADGPHLDPVRSRVLPGTDGYRHLMEGVSALVVLIVFANFARHFLFRPSILHVAGGPP